MKIGGFRAFVYTMDAVRARRKPRGTRPPKVESPKTVYRRKPKHRVAEG